MSLLGLLVVLRLTQPSPARAALPPTHPATVPTLPAAKAVKPIVTGVSYGTITWDGIPRRWRLYLPPGATAQSRLPLLVMLHQAGGDANTFVQETAMDSYAAQYRFATVAPEGLENTWNAGACCGASRDHGIDDIGFINAMLDRVIGTQPVDAAQVYAAGASNGGMMAYALACRLADRLQAVFSAGGAQTLSDCKPAAPITVVEFHALADTFVPFYGGVDPKYLADLTTFGSAQSTFRTWAATDECPQRTVADAGPSEQVELWYGCANSTLLEVWLRLSGGGHEWPLSPQAPVDASRMIAKAIASGQLVRRLGPSPNPLAKTA